MITRTYRTNLTNAGPFGLGTFWDYDRFLQPPPNGSPEALLLFSPGNRQDLFARQPDGTFVNTTSPALRGAVVTVAEGLRVLRFKDGTTWRFRVNDGLLVSQTDRNGNTVTITRDSQGRVTALTEPRYCGTRYCGTRPFFRCQEKILPVSDAEASCDDCLSPSRRAPLLGMLLAPS